MRRTKKRSLREAWIGSRVGNLLFLILLKIDSGDTYSVLGLMKLTLLLSWVILR